MALNHKTALLKSTNKSYSVFIKAVKQSIAESRYDAARLVNREMLLLYYKIGKMLSQKITEEKWGAKVIENISQDIQKSFDGIRGFSRSNLFNMMLFYQAYAHVELVQTVSGQLPERSKIKTTKNKNKQIPDSVWTI